VLMSLIIHLTQ